MASEPFRKRAVAFVDAQNLFDAVKEAFGYSCPKYDVAALATSVCRTQGWQLEQTRFYTGIPDRTDDFAVEHLLVEKAADHEPARSARFQPVSAISQSLGPVSRR